MNKIGIITNKQKDVDLKYTHELVKGFIDKGATVYLPEEISNELGLGIGIAASEIKDRCEIIVCLGGDGTFLKAARNTIVNGIPILGVNLGTLGFLTEVEPKDIEAAIDAILENKFYIDKRLILKVVIKNQEGTITDYAINDAVISRVALSRIIHLDVYVSGAFVDSFPGDGLIISTPTGSTAYSLSAGGPIVQPGVESFILSPICPHSLNSRPIVTPSNEKLEILIEDSFSESAMITLDGQIGYQLRAGDRIEITKANETINIASINKHNFYDILRCKIYNKCINKN